MKTFQVQEPAYYVDLGKHRGCYISQPGDTWFLYLPHKWDGNRPGYTAIRNNHLLMCAVEELTHWDSTQFPVLRSTLEAVQSRITEVSAQTSEVQEEDVNEWILGVEHSAGVGLMVSSDQDWYVELLEGTDPFVWRLRKVILGGNFMTPHRRLLSLKLQFPGLLELGLKMIGEALEGFSDRRSRSALERVCDEDLV